MQSDTINHNDPRSIQAELERLGFTPQKRFGQNFMINQGARENICKLARLQSNETVWEIGPGLGALTQEIVGKVKFLRVFEIDRGYVELLSNRYASRDDFALTEGDAMKKWPLFRDEAPACVIGNLPYNVASGIIADFLTAGFLPRMVFTIQREVGQRMMAKPGSSAYSSFSILCQVRCKVSMPMVLRPGSFWPAPDVTSAVVVLEARDDAPAIGDPVLFDELLRSLFAARRKTIENNLKASRLAAVYGIDVLKQTAIDCGIIMGDRAEQLDAAIIAAFSSKLSLLGKQ